MGLIKSVGKFFSTCARAFSSDVDNVSKKIEEKNIVAFAEQDVASYKEKFSNAVCKCGEVNLELTKTNLRKEAAEVKLKNSEAAYNKKLEAIRKETDPSMQETMKAEALALLRIKKSNEYQYKGMCAAYEALSKSKQSLDKGLLEMKTNVVTVEGRLATQKARKACLDVQKDVHGVLCEMGIVDANNSLSKLHDMNDVDEFVTEFNNDMQEDRYGDPVLMESLEQDLLSK